MTPPPQPVTPPQPEPPCRPSLAAPRRGIDLRTGSARAFGTFGELLQGALPGGPEFLVTLPVDRWARARFRLDPGGPLRVFPSHKTKTRRVAEAMLASCGRPAGGQAEARQGGAGCRSGFYPPGRSTFRAGRGSVRSFGWRAEC